MIPFHHLRNLADSPCGAAGLSLGVVVGMALIGLAAIEQIGPWGNVGFLALLLGALVSWH